MKAGAGGRETVLIVDDEMSNVRILHELLQKDYVTRFATSGDKALRIAASEAPPDLILLDVIMPEMDGYEVCRQLKANKATAEIPVVFITARTAVEDIVRGFELGAVDYVSKPFNAFELLARVNTHLTLHRLHRENERLLLNILPEPVARRLKAGEDFIADHHPDVSVLFADIVGFTSLSGSLSPQPLVELLNDLFTRFDQLAARFGVEKIKTIGDCYMAVCGLPVPRADHAVALADMAINMQQAVVEFNADRGTALKVRIGMNSGPVVAGVIGRSKFIYDLWGDTVNVASRMESGGLPDCIQIGDAMRAAIAEVFDLDARGEIEVRGKGAMRTWLVKGRRG